MNINRIMGFGLMIFVVVLGMGIKSIDAFIDMPSIQFVLGITIGGMLASNRLPIFLGFTTAIFNPASISGIDELKEYIRLFETGSRFALASGIIGATVGMILMLANMVDVVSIGPNMSVALLCPMYGIILSELVLQPLKQWLVTISPFIAQSEKPEMLKRDMGNWQVYAVGIIVPLVGILLVFLSVSRWPTDTGAPIENITSVSIEHFSASLGGTALAVSKDHSWERKDSRNMAFELEAGNDSIQVNIDMVDLLNPGMVSLLITFEHRNDSSNIHSAESFHYPCKLDGETDILLERNGYKLNMLISVRTARGKDNGSGAMLDDHSLYPSDALGSAGS